MIALGGPKLKLEMIASINRTPAVSMIALGGPKLKHVMGFARSTAAQVSMIALGGPKLKQCAYLHSRRAKKMFQ